MFTHGLCVGLFIGAVYIVAIDEKWRRSYNSLLAKYYQQRKELKIIRNEEKLGE